MLVAVELTPLRLTREGKLVDPAFVETSGSERITCRTSNNSFDRGSQLALYKSSNTKHKIYACDLI